MRHVSSDQVPARSVSEPHKILAAAAEVAWWPLWTALTEALSVHTVVIQGSMKKHSVLKVDQHCDGEIILASIRTDVRSCSAPGDTQFIGIARLFENRFQLPSLS